MKIFPLPVMVSGKFITKSEYKDLKKRKLTETQNNTFEGYVANYHKLRALQNYCYHHKLRFQINNSFGKRSSNYRQEFFIHYPPYKKDKYFCSYCGKVISKNNLTVDHLYPVHIVNKSSYYQAKLMAMGALSVNDYKNLVPACKKCNSKKSSKIQGWVWRGKIGRIQSLWPIRKFIKFLTIIILLSFIIWLYINYFNPLS